MSKAALEFKQAVIGIDAVADWMLTPTALLSINLKSIEAVGSGCVLLLCGYFENYLKAAIHEFICDLNSSAVPLKKIPIEMRYVHFENGGRVLKSLLKEDKKLRNTALSEDFSYRLATLTESQASYTLAWESFADTQANPGPEVISKMLKDVGIKEVWPEINKIVSSRGRLEYFLTSFIEKRNVCAHTGYHPDTPTGTEIKEHAENLIAITGAIDFLLKKQLEGLVSA